MVLLVMGSKSNTAVTVTTCLVIVYVTLTQLALPFAVIFLTFLLCLGGLFYMVITILKDKSHLSGKTFDDHFYEDIE